MSLNNIPNQINTCCETTCPTTTNPFVECVNPIDYFFQMVNLYSIRNDVSFYDSLSYFLENGLLLSNCGICCPECIYIFGDKPNVFDVINSDFDLSGYSCFEGQFGINPENKELPTYRLNAAGGNLLCCINIYGGSEESFLLEIIGGACTPCCNNFEECVTNLLEHFAENSQQGCLDAPLFNVDSYYDIYRKFVENLIIEQGSFNNEQSQVCRILDNLKKYIPSGCFINEFLLLLTEGLIVKCNDTSYSAVYIGGLDKFIQYENEISFP